MAGFIVSADVLDDALANISDVPRVEVDEDGYFPKVVFTGNYGNPVNDLVAFLAHLQDLDREAAEAVREGLFWEEDGYGSGATATLNGVILTGRSQYTEADEAEDED